MSVDLQNRTVKVRVLPLAQGNITQLVECQIEALVALVRVQLFPLTEGRKAGALIGLENRDGG